ncbi:hypothetical protein VI817_006089 [Penicillium citrinum]|uniref:Ubiquitin-like domain-containing protein n=1 Tax=Penicillium hetheringtonii TaxID=911720 RepID=A0AAD6DIB4_9EURO|nr:hypothetical protein N7450_006519 [Penicillium hetheringtonii]KAK5796806.1 hypothetical protein VI817_006089 [Penicillium citrinum]
MRSLFNKPEWASKTSEPQSDFYRRSGQTYQDIIAANEAAHRKVKASSETAEEKTVEKSTSSKRLRTFEDPEEEEEDEEEEEVIVDSAQPTKQNKPDGLHAQTPPEDQQKRSESPTSNKKKSPKIMRTDSSHAHSSAPIQSPSKHERLVHNTSVPVEDENKIKESPKRSPNTYTHHQSSEISSPPGDDPTVQILITSEIPSTKSLIVHRKMSQGLKDVRIEWCRRQEIPTETQNSVYLTWRGRRLFDVTTCKSLGIKPEKTSSDIENDQAAGKGDLQIHMVACTENPELLSRSSISESTSLQVSEDQQNQQMKLILRSAGYDDLKIKARPKTLVSKLISAFRDKYSIGTHQEMWVLFDGDRLDPDTCLRDHDVADLDMLEVQVRSQ